VAPGKVTRNGGYRVGRVPANVSRPHRSGTDRRQNHTSARKPWQISAAR
jgi:hypothetical protein